MKNLLLICIVLVISLTGRGQFVAMPLNFPNDSTAYMSWFTSIVDEYNIWVGTVHEGQHGYLPYSMAVKTTDGGNTWQFLPIPVPGTPWLQHLCAWDADICYEVFIDGVTYEGSVWKTTDAGASWAKITTTQFQGGWPNSIHTFSADTAVVMGDPNGGYFEIQITCDGGATWTRVPQGDVPNSLTGEWSIQGEYFAVGNTIGFGTSKGRMIRSNDRGLHWQARPVLDEYMQFCFSDSLHGIGFCPGTIKGFQKTTDGGNTWTTQLNPTPYRFGDISRIPGIFGGFVITACDTNSCDSLDVFYTNNFFSSITKIDSNITNATTINFKSPSIGWLGGSYHFYHNIHKYMDTVTSVPGLPLEPGRLSISPNPTRDAARLRVPVSWIGKEADLEVYDMTGRMILQRSLGKLPEAIQISASGIPDGICILEIVSRSGERLTQKWVISR